MSVLSQLNLGSLKKYSSQPVYATTGKSVTVQVDADNYITESESFAGNFSLRARIGDEVVYIPVAKGVRTDAAAYMVAEQTAVRDVVDEDTGDVLVSKGTMKARVIATA